MPASLNPTLAGAFPTLTGKPAATRIIVLKKVMGPGGPIVVTINGQYFTGDATETPTEGTLEEWVIVNLTADTHPIHFHLVTFQLISRQLFKVNQYTNDWLKLQKPFAPPFPRTYIPKQLDPTPYLQGLAVLPTVTEKTWKDILQMNQAKSPQSD